MAGMLRVLALLGLASLPALAEDLVVTLGKQRGAASPLQWEVREAGHPLLGPIRFAFLKAPVTTAVGDQKISSNIYLSCETTTRKIAVELTNSTRPDDPNGLKPRTKPRLVCNNLAERDKPRLVQDDLTAHWEVSAIGDVLARGISPYAMRECVSISVIEDVELPKGWAKPAAAIQFEIAPYGKELDDVFATCGQEAAYARAKPPTVAAAATAEPAKTEPAKAEPARTEPARPEPPKLIASQSTEGWWREARTTFRGRTNVRAKPALNAAIVIELDPGDVILVQRTGNEWWRAKARATAPKPFEGYIRQDRLMFK